MRELDLLSDGVDLGGLYRLADSLRKQAVPGGMDPVAGDGPADHDDPADHGQGGQDGQDDESMADEDEDA